MRLITQHNKAVSVVIGTLLLTLIVVSAATTFSLFVADRQRTIQAAQNRELIRDQENIQILGFQNLGYNDLTEQLETMELSIANTNSRKSIITAVRINDYLVENFTFVRYNLSQEHWEMNYSTGEYNRTDTTQSERIHILPQEHAQIKITNTSAAFPTGNIKENQPLIISIFTTLTKEFKHSFLPPTAVANIQVDTIWNASASDWEEVIILDGSLSSHPGDINIVRWEWYITETEEYAEAFLFQDNVDENWIFDNGETFDGDADEGIGSIQQTDVYGEYGGLYAEDPSGQAYTFIDLNRNWRYDENEPILSLDADVDKTKRGKGKQAHPKDGDFAGLSAVLNNGKKYFFADDVTKNYQWDNSEDYVSIAGPPPDAGDQGGLYGIYFEENRNNNPFNGRKARATFEKSGIYHYIKLIVIDLHGMKGTDTIVYYK